MSDVLDCDEPKRVCEEGQRSRAMAAIVEATAPNGELMEPVRLIAQKAKVGETLIKKLLQSGRERPDCNNPPKAKLGDLYRDDVPYWTQRNVKAVEAALQECSREQLAYLFSEVLPIFHANLRKEV